MEANQGEAMDVRLFEVVASLRFGLLMTVAAVARLMAGWTLNPLELRVVLLPPGSPFHTLDREQW
jgi:hypothetical protein